MTAYTSPVILAAIRNYAGVRALQVLEHPTDDDVLAVLQIAETLLRSGWFKEDDDATYFWNDRSHRIYIDGEA